MLAAMGIVFDAKVVKPSDMNPLDKSMLIGGALFPLF
jgi:hypothetical protein